MSRAVCCLIGGGGLIGRHLVPILQASGREVVVYDHYPPEANFPDTKYIVAQYDDESLLQSLLTRCEEIVDMAYASHHKSNFENPITDLINNAPTSVAIFQWALNCRCLRRILFVSSGGTVYGPTTQWPTQETATNQPISPFGITNLTLEKYAFMFHHTRGLPALVVRPGNAYGPGQMPFTGQGFIATAIGSVMRGQPVPVFGGGATVRDYIYVEDLARGILAALERGQLGEAYNLGTGVGLSNMQVLTAIESIAHAHGHGHEVMIEHHPARGFDVPINILDCSKITNGTGWQPCVAFDKGLAQTWAAISATLSKQNNLTMQQQNPLGGVEYISSHATDIVI